MAKPTPFLTIVFLVFGVNTVLVLYVFKDKFLQLYHSGLSTEFSQTIESAELGAANAVLKPKQPSTEKTAEHLTKGFNPEAETSEADSHRHTPIELQRLVTSCKPNAQKGGKTIYTWIDEDGTRHLSDKNNAGNWASNVKVAGVIKPEDLVFNVSGAIPFAGFSGELQRRFHYAREALARFTPSSLAHPVVIDLRFHSEPSAYNATKQKIAPSVGNAPGFYVGHLNQSHVLLTTREQSLRTATHEAMHAVNRHWFGNMPRWLNEGIAEYAETAYQGKSESGWERLLQSKGVLPLGQMISARSHDWNSSYRRQLYATSWAFVTYLIEQHPKGLTRLLLVEGQNGCDTVTPSQLEAALGLSGDMVENAFKRWLKARR